MHTGTRSRFSGRVYHSITSSVKATIALEKAKLQANKETFRDEEELEAKKFELKGEKETKDFELKREKETEELELRREMEDKELNLKFKILDLKSDARKL